jgi:hypothetical protein
MVITGGDALEFSDNVTDLDEAELNKLVERCQRNFIRNAHFGSWTDGAAAAPDCFNFSAFGGVISKESGAANVRSGKYSVKVTKSSGDANHSWLYYDASCALIGHIDTRKITFAAMIKTDRTNSCRIIVNTNVGTYYGSYNTTTNWETISVTFSFDDTVTYAHAAIECDKPILSEGEFYLDSFFGYVGEVAPVIDIGMDDFHPSIIGRENDGTFEHDPGAYRIIPFKHSWTAAAAATDSDAFTYTTANPDNRPRAHDHIAGFCVSCGGPNPQDVFVSFSAITANGFTIHIRSLSGVNFTATTVTIQGIVVARDWNDWESVHGDF